MTQGLQLWLDAIAGCVVPPECYAAVRPVDAALPSQPLTHCQPHEASCLGNVQSDAGPVIIDIFQRVGSITVDVLGPNSLAEGKIAWPGHPELTLRIAVVSADDDTNEGTPPQSPRIVVPRLQLGSALLVDQVEAREPLKGLPLKEEGFPPMAGDEEAAPGAQARAASRQRAPSKAAPQGAVGLYRPIILNNCNQIIPNLYLGGVDAVADQQKLAMQGIRAICCCCRELEFPSSEFSRDVEYFRVDVEDMGREPIEYFFPEATAFIHSWVSREQPVLVHCRAGVSRSASVVIAYLITFQGYSLHEAFFLVRSHRSIITPNIGFMEKLGEYEEAKRGTQPTIEINKYESWYTSHERAAVPDLMPD